MKKLLIVVHPDIGGIEYHRQLIPHYYLNDQEGWEVDQINEIDSADPQFIQQYDAVQFSRFASIKGNNTDILNWLRKNGVKSIVDIDDYWVLPSTHPMYYPFKTHKVAEQMIDSIVGADLVTTTTSHLAALIEPLNPNVEVIQNAINPDQPQFEIKPTKSDKIRFGWVGGVSHLDDIRLMESSLKLLNTSPFTEMKYQLYLMGFNENDVSGIYAEMEKIMTAGLKINADTYYRINGTNASSYAQGYNMFDVTLIPLRDNQYNNCKSELKLIEAGFMKKAAIVSDILPYTPLISESNCISIGAGYNYKHWYHAMRGCIENKPIVADMAEALHETVKDKYHIKTANALRMQVYERLIN